MYDMPICRLDAALLPPITALPYDRTRSQCEPREDLFNMKTRSQLSPGKIVKARCTGCGENREHKVVAAIDDKTFRVECTTCDNGQDYREAVAKRAGKPAPAKAAKPHRPRVDPALAEKKEWLLLRPDMDAESAVAYDMNGSYQAKVLLRHSAFGLGLVMRVAGPHKMEVLFESGKKLLRCQ